MIRIDNFEAIEKCCVNGVQSIKTIDADEYYMIGLTYADNRYIYVLDKMSAVYSIATADGVGWDIVYNCPVRASDVKTPLTLLSNIILIIYDKN
jgi:hypothetical protein